MHANSIEIIGDGSGTIPANLCQCLTVYSFGLDSPLRSIDAMELLIMTSFLAYIDPGTGSMLFQIFVASLLTVGVAFRSVRNGIIYYVKSLFSRKNSNPAPTDKTA